MRKLNEEDADKIRKYRSNYNNNNVIASTSGRLHSDFVRLLLLQVHRETDTFFTSSGVQLAQSDCGYFHFLRANFSLLFKSCVGNILTKATSLCINLNLDGEPITSKSHTHSIRKLLVYYPRLYI
jgi:hypothetical protein